MQNWDPERSPVAEELNRLCVPYRFLHARLNLRVGSRPQLFLSVYPRLIWNTLRLARRSLIRSAPPPDAVVVSTDIEALVFGLVRAVLRRHTLIVFRTLIVTPRASPRMNALYLAYWRLILSLVDLGICHSAAEVAVYERLFPRRPGMFAFVPYGTTITRRRDILRRALAPEVPTVVAAGRSGRDYASLVQAVAGLPCRLTIVCDVPGPLSGLVLPDHVNVLRGCYEDDYLQLLANATCVVVPLAVDDISTGQMVRLQAAALGRAVVLTRTRTTVDYATDEVDALMVGMGDVPALRHAIARLIDDPALRTRLGEAASCRFDREFSTEAFTRGLIAQINRLTEQRVPAMA